MARGPKTQLGSRLPCGKARTQGLHPGSLLSDKSAAQSKPGHRTQHVLNVVLLCFGLTFVHNKKLEELLKLSIPVTATI